MSPLELYQTTEELTGPLDGQRVRPKQSTEQDVTMETSIQQVTVSLQLYSDLQRADVLQLQDPARDWSRLHLLLARFVRSTCSCAVPLCTRLTHHHL